MATVAAMVGEHYTRLWRVLHHHVGQARSLENFSNVQKVGVDETSSRRGHRYVTVFAGLERAKVIFATEGKDMPVVVAFKRDLESQLTFDKLHLTRILSGAVDQVRREEQRERPGLKRTRYLWLMNPDAEEAPASRLREPHVHELDTARAYQLRLTFQDFWYLAPEEAESFLRK